MGTLGGRGLNDFINGYLQSIFLSEYFVHDKIH